MRIRWLALVCLAGCAIDGFGSTEQLIDEPISAVIYKFGGDETGSPVALPNARVEFIAPDNSVQLAYSDANGMVSAVSPAGTRVVVYQTDVSGHPLVRAFYNANPGDQLIVGYTPRQAFPLLGTVRFALPRRNPDSYYLLGVSCNATSFFGGPTFDVPAYACPQATRATAVAWVIDPSGNYITGPTVMRDLDLTQLVGSTVHMPGYAHAPSTASGEFINVPSGTPYVEWETTYLFDDDLKPFAGQVTYASGATATASLPGVGNRTFTRTQFQPPGYFETGHLLVENQRSSSYQLDASNIVSPAAAGTYDFSSRTFTWTRAPYGRPAALLQAYVSVGNKAVLQLYAPGDTSSLVLPPMPPELTPQPGDFVSASFTFADVSNTSYNDLLEQVSSLNYGLLNPYAWQPNFVGSVWYSTTFVQAR